MFSRKKIFGRKINSNDIDPDEIFLDSSNIPKFNRNQLEGNIEKALSGKIGYIFLFIALAVFLVFEFRLWNLEVHDYQIYTKRSEENRLRHALVFPDRGEIFDRNNKPLVINDSSLVSSLGYKTRKYLTTKGISVLIGFVKYPKSDSSGFLYQTEIVGMDGVEEIYNKRLAGESGLKIVEVDATNKIISEGISIQPKAGVDIKLSIDSDISGKFFDFIKQLVIERDFVGGAGVVMDTETGEVIALTNYPEYSSQVLTDGKDATLLASYSSNSAKPYLNRAVDGLYTPGSIVKPFVAIGVLNEKIIDPKKVIVSTGSISIPNEYDPTKKSVFKDWKALGPVDMRKAIALSSDVYFYEVGGGFEDQKGLGIEKIDQYMRLFGFGSEIDDVYLQGVKGTIPTPEWKELNFPNDPWRVGDTYNTVIGQYGMQVTLIQTVRALSAIANNGRLVEPTILFQDGSNPIKSRKIDIDQNYFQIVKEGMRQAVLEGTATGLNISSVKVAAKTGTAEVGIAKKLVNSWAIGFFPYDKPKYVFAVLMERGPRDNTVGALYAMRQFLEWLSINNPDYVE